MIRSRSLGAALILFGAGCAAGASPAPTGEGGAGGEGGSGGHPHATSTHATTHSSTVGTGGAGGMGGAGGGCVGGDVCMPTDVCHTGETVCSNGIASCVDMGGAANDGKACGGAGKVCHAGDCVACDDGADCTPTNACHHGEINCSTGLAICRDTGAAVDDATSCGVGQLCHAGVCGPCVEGASCVPANPCRAGSTSCTSGAPVCNDAGTDLADGASCGTDLVCSSGDCVSCVVGEACTPTATCHVGVRSCSGGPACDDVGTNRHDGSVCGADEVCSVGACVGCVAGDACTGPEVDPCAFGVDTCRQGFQECISGGANPAQNNVTCGGTGKCKTGRCSCAAGSGYNPATGLCASCNYATASTLYVNADALVGDDDRACCGGSPTSTGFDGPCLTIGRAFKAGASLATLDVDVTPREDGNVSDKETYPLLIPSAATLHLNGACVPGAADVSVIKSTGSVRTGATTILGGSLGKTCQGVSSGASEGIVSNIAQDWRISTKIGGTGNGMTFLNGGNVDLSGTVIDGVTVDGVSCYRAAGSPTIHIGGTGIVIRNAGARDVWSNNSCSFTGDWRLGAPPTASGACALPKVDQFGVMLQGSSQFGGSVTVTCVDQDGVSLRYLSGDATLAPVFNGVLNASHAGCAGIYAEFGQVRPGPGSEISNNHWGVIARGVDPAYQPDVDLSSTGAPVDIRCNSAAEPGSCCSPGDCEPGSSVWNNSGAKVIANGVQWQRSDISVCTCDGGFPMLCICTGSASGQTKPPDGAMIVNYPFLSGQSPKTDASPILSSATPACQ